MYCLLWINFLGEIYVTIIKHGFRRWLVDIFTSHLFTTPKLMTFFRCLLGPRFSCVGWGRWWVGCTQNSLLCTWGIPHGVFSGEGRVSLVRPWSVTVFNRSYLILVSVSDCNYCENQDRIPYRVIPERPMMFLGCLLWLWDVSWRLWSSANTHRQMIPRWIWLMYYWYFCDNAVKENVWKQFIRMFAYCEVWKK